MSKQFTRSHLSKWLPSRGNVLFTLLIIGAFFWAQTAGVIAAPVPAAPTANSTNIINYQGYLADSNGDPVNGELDMTFRIYTTATDGTPLWEETWSGSNIVTVADGVFNVSLGSINTTLTQIVQGHNDLYLGIWIGASEILPRTQFGSAFSSIQALSIPSDIVSSENIIDGTISVADIATDNWGLLSRIQGLIVIPEGQVLDDGNGNITLPPLIIMNPISGAFLRVETGNYSLGAWGFLYVDLPPSVANHATVTPQVGEWIEGSRPFDGKDRFLIAQRNSLGRVYFNFAHLTGQLVDITAGDAFIQYGETGTVTGNNYIVNFPTAFSTPPKVFITQEENLSGAGSGEYIVHGISSTQFRISHRGSGVGRVQWMAVGR